MSPEEQLRLILDNIPTLAWSAHTDGEAEFFNRRWLEYTGLSADQARDWGWTYALHPNDLSQLVSYWKSLLNSSAPGEIEARLRRHDGEFRWFLFRANPVHDESGRVLQWCGTYTDITDRKRAEDALRASEQNFRLVVAHMPGLMNTLTAGGEIEFVNQQTLDYFGKTLEELKHWPSSDAVHPEDLRRVIDARQQSLETGTPDGSEIEMRLRRVDGTYRWFYLRRLPLLDSEGKIVRWYSLLTDIDERKQAEEALRQSEERFRLVIDSVAGLIAIAAPDGEVEFVNQQTLDYFGKTLENLKGWCTSDAVHPAELSHVIDAWRHSLETGNPYDLDHRLRRADGVYRWFHAYGRPLRDAESQIVSWYVLLTDIEERKQAEEKLRRSEADLHEAQRLSLTGSFKFDALSGKVTVSPETSRRYAVTSGDDTSHLEFWFNRIHPEDRQRVREDFKKCLMRKSDYEADYRIVLPDGTLKYEHAFGHPVLNESGDLVEFIGTSIDVTERHRLERALQHERDRLRLLLDLNSRVASQLGLSQLFQTISTELRRVFKSGFIGMACPDHSGKYLRQYMVDYFESKGFFKEGQLFPLDASCSGVALQSGKSFMIKNLSEGMSFWSRDEAFSKIFATEPFKSGCFLPMISSGQILGVLQVTSLKEGAFTKEDLEFLEQVAAQVAITLKNAFQYEQATETKDRLHAENVVLREQIDQALMFEEIVGSSAALQNVLSSIVKVAPTDSTVLITGETGTGKELIARAIHKRSQRSNRAFVSVNCASIPSSLVASELFGHEKGAFTGALQQRQGRFELANGGTIFLDEVGELPAETQVALLRVLQERQFERVGGNRLITTDIRVIAATNRDLAAAIVSGTFRSDLFYRLNVFPIQVPALRHRKEDIQMLLEYFVKRFSKKMGRHIRRIDKKTLDLCQRYDWQGNIRELQNIVERSVILSENDIFSIEESSLSIEKQSGPERSGPLRESLLDQERKSIEAALVASNGKIAGKNGAAVRLGIPPSTLDSKIKQLRIRKEELGICRDKEGRAKKGQTSELVKQRESERAGQE